VDAIHAAINDGKEIAFRYFDYNGRKKRAYRKNGALYQVTLIALCWDNDKYYLIAYSAEHDELRNYRVDRMGDAKMLDEDADSFDRRQFDVAGHVRQMFGMYSGETISATLSFDESLVNVVLDYFGKDVSITSKSSGKVEVKAEVSVSPVFFAWMFQFGDRAEIKGPDSLITAMREQIKSCTGLYNA
jgi:predicted DNA-binding transcriptional regulator YafY